MMQHVLLALLPGILCASWIFGWGILINLLLATATAILAEAAMLAARKRPVRTTLLDGSAAVTGVLLALTLPPLTPWWIAVIGSLFAIVVAKQLYGGLGYNPFNPAMAGYVVLLISFPLELTLWTQPGQSLHLLETLSLVFTGNTPDGLSLDAFTMATPLDSIKTRIGLNETLTEIQSGQLFGVLAGRGWEWINLAFLLGGIWLLVMKVIQWHIPAGMLAGLFISALLFYMINPDVYPFTGISPAQRRRHAGRVFYCHRSGDRQHHPARAHYLRRGYRAADLHHPHLGRLPGRHRLRRAPDEPGGTDHRSLHPAACIRPPGALNELPPERHHRGHPAAVCDHRHGTGGLDI